MAKAAGFVFTNADSGLGEVDVVENLVVKFLHAGKIAAFGGRAACLLCRMDG